MPGLLHTDSYTGIAQPTSTVITGLDVAGNTEWSISGPTVSPSPRWGWQPPPLEFGALTFLWEVTPREQPNSGGYWTSFFLAQDSGNGVFDFANWNYIGPHPYPNPPEHGTPQWEISADGGGDFLSDVVVFDRKYRQVVRITPQGGGFLLEFIWDYDAWLLNPANGILAHSQGTDHGTPPNPILVFFDAHWRVGGEVYCGMFRHFVLHDASLSDADVAAEWADPGSTRTPGYINLNPTPEDITNKGGTWSNPVWFSADRPSLFTGEE